MQYTENFDLKHKGIVNADAVVNTSTFVRMRNEYTRKRNEGNGTRTQI